MRYKMIFCAQVFGLLVSGLAMADVVRDGSIGPSAAVQPSGPNFVIPETFGAQQGGNLFHSFNLFDLNHSETATFSGNNTITNIISRITGNSTSTINGGLTSTVGGANVFFINPQGIVLGADAKINVTGSVFLSTANFLTFSNGERFNSSDLSGPILSASTPSAFGFLGSRPASVVLQDIQLNLANNTLLSIVSGDIEFASSDDPTREPQIRIEGGNIAFISVASQGEVAIGLSPDLDAFTQLGSITIDGAGEENPFTLDVSGDPTGSVVLRGGRLDANNFSILSEAQGANSGNALAIDINMRESLSLSANSVFSSPTVGSARAGNLLIEAPAIELNDDSELLSDSNGLGAGGNILINSTILTLNDDTEIASDGEVAGDGGNIVINTAQLIMTGDSEISTDTDPGSTGLGGSIIINASTSIDLQIQVDPGEQAGLFVNSEGTGNAGDITITTPSFNIDGGSVVATSEQSDGGNLNINSRFLRLQNGELIANVKDGTGGNVTVNSDTVILDRSSIVAQAQDGRGGIITITGARFFASESVISASAGPAGISGSVTINTPEVNLSAGLVPLSTEIVDASALLKSPCAVSKKEAETGRFLISTLRVTPATLEGFSTNEKRSVDVKLAISHSNTARNLVDAGARTETLLPILRQASIAIDALPPHPSKIHSLIHLAISYQQMNGLERAYQALKQAEALAKQLEDLRAQSYVLGNLALLYQSEQRPIEALHLAQKAAYISELAEAPESTYRWYWLEGQVSWRLGKTDEALAAYRRAIKLLEQAEQGADFHSSIAPVYQDFVSALLQSTDALQEPEKINALLIEARATIEQYRASELRNYFQDPCIVKLQSKVKALDEISNTAAVVYPIVLEDRVELLISFPKGIERFSVPVGEQQLTTVILEYRDSLESLSRSSHLKLGRQLFEWLVKPYLHKLQENEIETLVFVPDGLLGTIPLSALYDGERYLIEHYAIAITPGLNVIDPKPLDRSDINILLAGISESVDDMQSLPMVGEELKAIQNLFPSHAMLNEDFKREGIKQALLQDQYNIVHIASHAVFGGKADENYVLAYDGHLTINDLSDYIGALKYREKSLELLVLSACETAAGDERAILGLAGAAIKAGARSAVGSLWEITDDAAFLFIESFYRTLKETDVSKAAAVRKAQLKLLQHQDFNHPYYWAPFVMINNWL